MSKNDLHFEFDGSFSRETNSGMRLEVNDKILDSCNGLMNAVRELVIRSKEVQEEIVAQGKGATTPSEFYKKNHLWTEGEFKYNLQIH